MSMEVGDFACKEERGQRCPLFQNCSIIDSPAVRENGIFPCILASVAVNSM